MQIVWDTDQLVAARSLSTCASLLTVSFTGQSPDLAFSFRFSSCGSTKLYSSIIFWGCELIRLSILSSVAGLGTFVHFLCLSVFNIWTVSVNVWVWDEFIFKFINVLHCIRWSVINIMLNDIIFWADNNILIKRCVHQELKNCLIVDACRSEYNEYVQMCCVWYVR